MSGIEQCLWLCLSALGPSSVPQNKGVTCASEAGGWQSGGRRPRPCGHPRPRCGHRWPLSTAAHGRTLGRPCSVDPDLPPSRGPRRCRRSGPQPSQRCLRRAKGRGAHRGQGQGHDLTAAGAAGAAAGPSAAGRARPPLLGEPAPDPATSPALGSPRPTLGPTPTCSCHTLLPVAGGQQLLLSGLPAPPWHPARPGSRTNGSGARRPLPLEQ